MGTMRADFGGEVVLITGAAGGMGRATAVAFARAGAAVVLADVDEDGLGDTLAAVEASGRRGSVVRADVADEHGVAQAVGAAVDGFGALHHAVNAAAIETETAPLHECGPDEFDRMQSVNLRGCFLSMRAEIDAMLANDPVDGVRGTIVNIASTNSFRPQRDQPAYTASKHGVLGLTRSAAYDYAGRGIRVNAICPGTIDTPMLRAAMTRRGREPGDVVDRLSLIGRFGTPDEIADAALWLCSDASSFTYGHPLAVDGGMLAH